MKRIDAASVRAAIPVAEFYLHECPSMKPTSGSGWVAAGLCPFHDDRHAGSFRVNLASGGFYCHACGAGGKSIVDFVMLRDGLSFPDALQRLSLDWRGGVSW